jgi:hypothetical protein
MKIKEFDPSIQPLFQPKERKTQGAQGLDFQKLLIGATERLNGGKPIDQQDQASIRSQTLKAVENTLTTLEKYHEGLSNPETFLRKIEPFVQALTKEVDGLNLLSEKLPPDDPLRKILNETKVLSAVEVEKFRRGDYL